MKSLKVEWARAPVPPPHATAGAPICIPGYADWERKISGVLGFKKNRYINIIGGGVLAETETDSLFSNNAAYSCPTYIIHRTRKHANK